jgi:hypothetical protein
MTIQEDFQKLNAKRDVLLGKIRAGVASSREEDAYADLSLRVELICEALYPTKGLPMQEAMKHVVKQAQAKHDSSPTLPALVAIAERHGFNG